MGIISIEQADRLYWLGRYTERVYTTIRLYSKRYDIMLDKGEDSYDEFCRELDIPNIYKSADDFRTAYAFSAEDPNSIYSNLIRAYDNAIELRDMIGSEALSYIQLAIYGMNRARQSEAPLVEMQKINDNILAFWGITDDMMDDEKSRNTIKVGKRVERIDLYGRLKLSEKEMRREVHRLLGRIDKCCLDYNKEALRNVSAVVESDNIDYYRVVQEIERILE
ncbi:MAG: alpha-E domain-containing protein [Clostridia bacterium]|nr:alpha-E domain-containing protein [Clostridia bacterium]